MTKARSNLRTRLRNLWSIRFLILISIVGLLVLFLVVTLAVHRRQIVEALGRGDYLATHFNRLVASTEYIGGFLEVMVGTTASDTRLIRCLGGEAPALGAPGEPAKLAPAPRPTCSPAKRWREMAEKLDAAFSPEMVLLTGADDEPIGPHPEELTAEVLRRSLFYLQASQGQSESGWVELAGETYLMAGAPVKGDDGQRLGTVLVGIALERLFWDHARASSSNPAKFQRPFFVADGRTLAAAFKTKMASREALAQAFVPENRKLATEGGETIEVLKVDDLYFDFHTRPHNVYSGSKVIEGHLVMSRQRAHFRERQHEYSVDIYWTGGIGLVLGLILALILAWSIIHPLQGFIQYTEQMARGGGDLTHRFPVKGYSELAKLAQNLNDMLDQLRFLFNRVKQSSLEVGNSATEISVTASQLHQRAQEQSIKIEDITTAINEMNQMIQQLAANATEAAEHAKRGSEAVSGASSAIVDIRKVVVDSSEHVRNLGDHSARIGNIVETIRQIADQTSLLALNASIEAAHAGEHGKGFAVVANEVSNLAERVNKSARQIEEQLAQIRLLTEGAVRKMEEGTSTVDSSVVRVDSTFRDLTDMMSVVQEIGEREKEQAQVSDNIARNMEDIFTIVREGLNATEQTVNEGERLKDLAKVLLEGVDKFKTTGEQKRANAPALPARRAEDQGDEPSEP